MFDRCKIAHEDRSELIRSNLRDNANEFFAAKVTSHHHWIKVEALFAEEFSQEAQQSQCSEKLHILKFSDFAKHGQVTETTLSLLCNHLDKLLYMAEPKDQTDREKTRNLKIAFTGQQFVLLAFGRLRCQHSFSELHQAL